MNDSIIAPPEIKRTFVVGTSGHVDHGKSTLVRRLTGIDPDRLQEEKAREMTIDLGFAWLEMADGKTVSIIDVPGHERFIKNMLAGVGGLDAALLVVAADEGPMPQTLEHLAILDLLDVSSGIVVMTKSDIVDEEWLELVCEETRETLTGTSLEGAEIITVSSQTGAGIEELLAALSSLLDETSPQGRTGRARMPVDRVFSVPGFGTVVTGTLLGNQISVGQELELLPSMARVRVRGLQSHNEKVDTALPGSRTAVNLSGIDREAVQRGDVLTTPGWLKPTRMIDARLRLVGSAPQPLQQNDPVDIFVGAAEAPAHVTLLDCDQVLPGSEGWVQLRLDRDLVVVEGDQFIVRQASPSVTIGGGQVLNPHPRRHRRFRDDVIEDLETRASGSIEDRVMQALSDGPLALREVADAVGSEVAELQDVVLELVDREDAVLLGAGGEGVTSPSRLVARTQDVREATQAVVSMLAKYHEQYPLRAGMPREEIRSRLSVTSRIFDAFVTYLGACGSVDNLGNTLAMPGYQISLSPEQKTKADRFIDALNASPETPPAASAYGIDPELLGALSSSGALVRMGDNVVYSSTVLESIQAETLRLIDEHGELTLAQFRDHFGSSRKYAQAVLEYFDQQRVTRRVGDVRVRGSG